MDLEVRNLRQNNSLVRIRKEIAKAGYGIDFTENMHEEADDDKAIEWMNRTAKEEMDAIIIRRAGEMKGVDAKKARELYVMHSEAELSSELFKQIRAMHAGFVDVIKYYDGSRATIEACRNDTLGALKALEGRHAKLKEILDSLVKIGQKKRTEYINIFTAEINCIKEVGEITERIKEIEAKTASMEYKEQLLANQLGWKKSELEQLKAGAGT